MIAIAGIPRTSSYTQRLSTKVSMTPPGAIPPCAAQSVATTGLAAEHCQKNDALVASYQTSHLIHDKGSAFVSLLRTCSKNKDLRRGILLHEDISQRGLLEKCAGSLLTMYAKCGALGKAKELLDMHQSMDVITWTALISGYAQAGQAQNAVDCFECMQRQGLLPNNIVLGTALVDIYVKCGALTKAQRVHEELIFRDAVSWNALISGYSQKGQGEQALFCSDQMHQEGISPNAITYLCILQACSALGNIDKGKQIHEDIANQGLLNNNVVLGTALVDMYAKCGALSKTQCVLEELPSWNVVAWSALITGYAQEGQAEQALSCFERMQCDGIAPNAVTYVAILKVCGSKGATFKGKQIHDEIVRRGLLENNIVLGSALVDMYAKRGALSEAQHVLEGLPSRDVISWSALVAGYAEEGQGEQALSCFECMRHEGIHPNAVTYASVLKACGTIGAGDKGEQIHDDVVRQGLLQNNVVLGTAVVDMYAKCGALLKVRHVLEELPSRNVVSWNALITGYAEDGQGEQALSCFERMLCEGLYPNAVTFVCVLNVCSHLGLVAMGRELFVSMSSKYGVKPNLECYTSMVDLFGRAGHLERAGKLIEEMPSSDHLPIWLALLGACQKWGDVNVGKWAFKHAIQVDRSNEAPYVLIANIYASVGMKERLKL